MHVSASNMHVTCIRFHIGYLSTVPPRVSAHQAQHVQVGKDCPTNATAALNFMQVLCRMHMWRMGYMCIMYMYVP